jgi:UPF0755 protein
MRRTWVLGGILLLLAGLWLWKDYQYFVHGQVANSEAVVLEVNKGESVSEISNRLHERNVISKPLWFIAMAVQSGLATKLKYGEYEIEPFSSNRKLLDTLASGRPRQHSVTLVEGWRFSQILEALSSKSDLVHTLATNPVETDVMGKLEAPGENPEGRFFPDTYFFDKGATDIDILRRAYQKMQRVLDAEWHNRNDGLTISTPYEALTLASIIEKETAQPNERPMVAGVFQRRLSKGMYLQTDPTVIYGLGQAFLGDLTREHLSSDSPYNTYTRHGLPPTPIAIPSLASIRAALHPDTGNSLYFVSKGDGSHHFSESLPLHNQAVDHFQKSRE